MKTNHIFLCAAGAALIVLYGFFDPARYSFPQCPMKMITGLLCPGCGSQRAIHQALHGNFAASLQLNFLLLPAVLYAFLSLIGPYVFSGNWQFLRTKFFGKSAAFISLGIIVLFWVGRNIL